MLADHGILTGPVTTWPLAWGPIVDQIRSHDGERNLPAQVANSLARIRERAQWETRVDIVTFSAEVGGAESPARIRSFQDTPRDNAEVELGASLTGNLFTVTLKGQVVDRVNNDVDVRADGSHIGFAFGNWTLSANTLDPWWGPGWDGSIILSNNARPFPALSCDRNFTDAFETPWLAWLGPWDLNVMMGQLESNRHIPETRFFGMRFNFRPIPSLEIGVSRTAQWCGEGRPCDASVFVDLLLGQDNIGDDDIGEDNEPGNQLVGADIRWAPRFLGIPAAMYVQMIGEDEAGGFPSRYLGQAGVEMSGSWGGHWSWRWFGEFAGTTCQFYESSEIFNCGYNHGIYQTGYRYRGRSIGHGADNDTRLLSTGLLLVDTAETQWRVLLCDGELNRGGAPDPRNTVSAVPKDILSVDLSHSRAFRYGVVEIGLGFVELETEGAEAKRDGRAYLQWRSGY